MERGVSVEKFLQCGVYYWFHVRSTRSRRQSVSQSLVAEHLPKAITLSAADHMMNSLSYVVESAASHTDSVFVSIAGGSHLSRGGACNR